ncbi:alpha,alpha-trehalase TreF [Sphingopyxis sp.]|uniref:alpha,alpha-trehalase TreF n=1 Tax=Sphingopyxis sp. TaxID=1908224 RepID=UPI003BACFFBD
MISSPSPADLYGPLLAKVQERAILADGKTFVDALPKRMVADIMRDFARLPSGDEALRAFVADNFDLPTAICGKPAAAAEPLRDHIRLLWKELARAPDRQADRGSALPVKHRHVVPGGRFREIYYWDSFFTMLGLVRDGETELATGVVDAMTDLIETHGHVPNGTRTYYLGRSQPPLYHMMVELLGDQGSDAAARRLAAMKREHAWWMAGAQNLEPGSSAARVVRLADGALLNRYWDPRDTPRDESWREDVETAASSDRKPEEVYRDLRAGAESGWDFSSRWLGDATLPSIRTTAIAPVDLNAFLFGLEIAIAASGDEEAGDFSRLAAERHDAMARHLWNAAGGYFCDYDIERGAVRPALTAAALAPLLVGAATQAHADHTAIAVKRELLAPGGLRTTLVATGEQWDSPNGWAPLQWIAVAGFRGYRHDRLAGEIARRWVHTVAATFARTGLLFEKYDVETATIGGGGEYAPQTGFGWTNGVTADFIDSYGLLPPTE